MKPIFAGNKDFTKSSFLNWKTQKHEEIQNLLVLAEGFLSSAIELGKRCLEDNTDKKADMLIFPMLTNANHGIELYLKAMNWMLNILTRQERKIEGAHNIKQILENVKARIKEYSGHASLHSFNETIHGLQEYINELFDKIKATPKDDKMDFSRYPFGNKYENHFYVDELNNIEIDLENFVVRFQEILAILDDRASYYYYQELNQEW